MTGGTARGRRATWAGIAVVIVALACLGGCTDDSPTPPATTPASATTSSTTTPPSPTPTPPTAPTAKPTPQSAEAFVRYFWDVFNYAHLALDPAPLKGISGPDCLFCRSAVDVVTGLIREKKHVRGGMVRVHTAVAPPGNQNLHPVITLVISQTPGQTLDSAGVTSETSGVRSMRSEVALDWTGDAWQIRDVANDEKSGSKW